MSVAKFITDKVETLPAGQIFTYTKFLKEASQREAIIKALNRLAAAGKLAKLAKGKFYKAENTVFGELEPSQQEVVKDLLEENGRATGYLTGYLIFNRLGLTTQISHIIQIGKNDIRPQFQRGRYKIKFIRQKNEITKDNIPLLQILDAIRYVKTIPDALLLSSLERLFGIIQKLPSKDKKRMVDLLFKYPAATRALTGAMLEKSGNLDLANRLRLSLNPVTIYKVPGIDKFIGHAENWNIK